jgi:segregation and condensation protein B
MDYFGINNTDDLPKIREVLADQVVEATVIKPEDFTTPIDTPLEEEEAEAPSQITVNENGDLVIGEEGGDDAPAAENTDTPPAE